MNRIFVVDPVCVLRFGHNPQQLSFYTEFFKSEYGEVIPICCADYPPALSVERGFNRHFAYYYNEFMPLNIGDHRKGRGGIQNPPALDLEIDRFSNQIVDSLERRAIADWLLLFESYDISAGDHIFYPSADFYGVCGLLKVLAYLFPNNLFPSVHIRFIGVMENATNVVAEPLDYLASCFKKYDPANNTELSAESPVYSRYLGGLFGRQVATTLYPLKAEPLEFSSPQEFIVFSGGSGRMDKGFSRVLEIAVQYSDLYPKEKVTFVLQQMNPSEAKHHAYLMSQTFAAPNVDVLPAVLSQTELHNQIRRSHLLLAPYDFEVYRFRGSAMAQEGLSMGRPILMTKYSGFHDFADKFETFHNCCSNREFCEVIHHYYKRPIEETKDSAHLAALEYERLSFDSAKKLFRDKPDAKVLGEILHEDTPY